MARDVILTPEGLEKLKGELEDLQTNRRREVAERIKEAREFGDISENSEYDDAKNEQMMLEQRIAQLEERLRSAQVVDPKDISTDSVQVGSVVSVKDEKTGKSQKFTIVGSAEANPAESKLSNESPVGRALIGHKRNDIVVGAGAARAGAQAQDHQDRRRVVGAAAWPTSSSHAAREARPPPRRRDRPVPARVRRRRAGRRRAGGPRRPARPARRPTRATAWPGACTRAAARARWPSSTSTTARAASSCRPRVDVLGEERMAQLLELDLGDLIGVDGLAFRSGAAS